jgi:GNAT superfamily N-acetyltransferase
VQPAYGCGAKQANIKDSNAGFAGKRFDLAACSLYPFAMIHSIRPVEPGDIPAMAAIRAREWENEAYWIPRITAYLSGAHSPQRGLAPRAGFVALDAGVVVGFVAGHLTRRYDCDGELEWINVLPEKRGLGVAGRLIQTMASWFVSQRAYRVCVDVVPENTVARKLYAKCGARPLNPHWMVWEDVRQIGLFPR